MSVLQHASCSYVWLAAGPVTEQHKHLRRSIHVSRNAAQAHQVQLLDTINCGLWMDAKTFYLCEIQFSVKAFTLTRRLPHSLHCKFLLSCHLPCCGQECLCTLHGWTTHTANLIRRGGS